LFWPIVRWLWICCSTAPAPCTLTVKWT
jgi:hypothetical protein